MRRQLELLKDSTSFRLLFLATLGSGIGTWLAVVALGVHVKNLTGSGSWVAALYIAEFLPAVVIGLALGPLVDRLSRRGLMIASDLVRFGVFVGLVFVDSAAGVVVLAGVAGFATGFFRPAVHAGMPNLVTERQLPAANALFQTAENATIMAGPVAGGAIVASLGVDAAYWINAVTFLVSAALLAGIPARLLQSAKSLTRGHWRDLADGIQIVLRSRALLAVLVVWNVVMVANAAVNVSEIFLATDTLDAGAFGFGMLWAASGLGLTVGALAGSAFLERRALSPVYTASIALWGIGIAVAAAAPHIAVAAAGMAVAGLGNGAAILCNVMLVQRGAPDELRGRAFTVIMSSNFVVLGVAMAAAGPFTDALGARWVFAVAAGALAVSAAVAAAMTRGVPAAEPEAVAAAPLAPPEPVTQTGPVS